MLVKWVKPQFVEPSLEEHYILTSEGKRAVGRKTIHGWYINNGQLKKETEVRAVLQGIVQHA